MTYTAAETDMLLQAHDKLEQTIQSIHAIDQQGVTPATLSVLKATGLLSQVSFMAIATESMSGHIAQDNLAIEALTNEASEKSAAWSAKVINVLKNIGNHLLEIFRPVGDKLLDIIEDVKAAMKDKVIDAGEEIKAHPFKTVMMALAAITAAMAVLAFCGSRMPGGMASREVFVAFFGKIKDMLSAIPFPGSGIKAAATARAGVTITPVTIPTKVVGTARSLGWSGPTVNEVCNGSATVVRSAFSTIGVFARQAANFVVKGVPKAFEAGRKFTKQAPVMVHAVTRSKFLGHASYIGLTVAFYGFCLKLALLAAKIVYEICCTAVLIIKSTMILFL